jgi:peptidoglycan/xylan/chitin deacetylase (PgdA/CDA1 family)
MSVDPSTVLKFSLDFLHATGVATAMRSKTRGIGAIFCLHHVCPGGGKPSAFSPNYQLEITPEFLEETIRICQRRGYDLVSLDEAVNRTISGNPSGVPFAAFTLDDGYRDNAQHAAPVFRRYNCPYTIFVSPKIADGTCVLWWRVLELLIADRTSLTVQLNGSPINFDTAHASGKAAAWSRIFPSLKDMQERSQRSWISDVAAANGFDAESYCRSVAMSWDEIKALNADPLCTFGAHTMDHVAIGRLSADEALDEMRRSRITLEQHLGAPVRYFAYPYGDPPAAGARDFALAEQAGFRASVTTRKGVVFAAHGNHLQAIPRIMLSGRYQKARYVDTLISGAPFALLNRFRQLNVN